MLQNKVIEEHATAELKKDNPDLYSKKSILLANFSFVLRIVGYHIALVTLASNALICCIVLLFLEVAYLSLIVRNFLKLRYLISIHLFVSKATQSFFLIVFHLISLSILMKTGIKMSPGVGIQKLGMWAIIVSIACEYFFLIVNIVYIIRGILRDRKNPKKKAKADQIVYYKWVKQGGWEKNSTAENSETSRVHSGNTSVISVSKSKAGKLNNIKVKRNRLKKATNRIGAASQIKQAGEKRRKAAPLLKKLQRAARNLNFETNMTSQQN
jgi:hypothetical protein